MDTTMPEITQLPLPSSGKIDEVIHLGDIHIPFIKQPQQLPQKERLSVFWEVIEKIISAISEIDSIVKGRAVILVVGDVLDCRNTANADTVALLNRLVSGLCHLAPVYITAGNHDVLLEEYSTVTTGTRENAERVADLLGALLQPMLASGLPVAYIDKTGLFGTPGTGAIFGVLHIRDAMVPGSCSGDMRSFDEMPLEKLALPTELCRCEQCEDREDVRVFVFHGQVARHSYNNSSATIPDVAAYHGYHVCMLGDTHTMQLHNMKKLSDSIRSVPTCGYEFVSEEILSLSLGVDEAESKKDRPIPWGYCGSTMQLGACEKIFPHGFLVWAFNRALNAVTARPTHLQCSYGTIVMEEDRGREGHFLVHNGVGPILGGESASVQSLEELSRAEWICWFPPRVSLRLVGNIKSMSLTTLEAAASALKNRLGTTVEGISSSGVRPLSHSESDINRTSSTIMSMSDGGKSPYASTSAPIDLSNLGTPNAWIEYLLDNQSGNSRIGEWTQFLTHPESIIVPPLELGHTVSQSQSRTQTAEEGGERTKDGEGEGEGSAHQSSGRIEVTLPGVVDQKLNERNVRINKKVNDAKTLIRFESGPGASDVLYRNDKRRYFSLGNLRWSWILCYGQENVFDFRKIEGRVALLSAPNGRGKSSMLEVVCLALYGLPMPSRGGKASVTDVPCKYRPQGTMPSCSIDVILPSGSNLENGSIFRITRNFNVSSATGKVTMVSKVSKLVAPYNIPVTLKEGSAAVNSWVTDNLGSLQGFLLCSLLTQHCDLDFFSMKSTDQRALLDDALALDAVRSMCDALKEARLAHATMTEAVQTTIETSASAVKAVPNEDWIQETITQHRSQIDELNSRLKKNELQLADIEHDNDDTNRKIQEQMVDSNVMAPLVTLWRNQGEDEPNLFDDNGSSSQSQIIQCPILTIKETLTLLTEWTTWKSKWPSEWLNFSLIQMSGRSLELKSALQSRRDRLEASEDNARQFRSSLKASRDKFDEIMRLQKDLEDEITSTGTGDDIGDVDIYELYGKATSDLDNAKKRKDDFERISRKVETVKSDLEQAASRSSKIYILCSDVSFFMPSVEAERAIWQDGRKSATVDAIQQGWLGSHHDEMIEKDSYYDHVYDSVRELHSVIDKLCNFDTKLTHVRLQLQLEEERTKGNDENGNEDKGPYNEACWACQQRKERCAASTTPSVLVDVEKIAIKEKERNDLQEEIARFKQGRFSNVLAAKEKSDDLCRCLQGTSEWLRKWKANKYSSSVGASELVSGWAERDLEYCKKSAMEVDALCAEAKISFEQASSASRVSKMIYKQAKDRLDSPGETTKRQKKNDAIQKREEGWKAIQSVSKEIRVQEAELDSLEKTIVFEEKEARGIEQKHDAWKEFMTDVNGREDFNDENKNRGWKDKVGQLQKSIKYWKDKYAESTSTRRRLEEALKKSKVMKDDLCSEQESLKRMIEQAEKNLEKYVEFATKFDTWRVYRDIIDDRRRSLMQLESAMEGFTAWVYSRRALPALQKEVNMLLSSITTGGYGGSNIDQGFQGQTLTLKGYYGGLSEIDSDEPSSSTTGQNRQQQISNGTGLSWTVNDMPLTKCSGMQRFAVSLAMRLALAQLGACNVTCAQLMIDEGFGALDASNITAVPDFLHIGILGCGRYASVLLVSHLDGVREAADVIVPIKGGDSPLISELVFQ